MKQNKNIWTLKTINLVVIITIMILLNANLSIGVPQGPQITYNNTETPTLAPATQITTAGGTFTTITINATQQTPRWKAYAGNVSGRLVLDDATSKSIYDWTLSSVTGEVYASRNSSIDWSTIACADSGTIINEQTSLNMTGSQPDSINNTFKNTVHRRFYTGTQLIQNSTCYAVATYVNDSMQSITENASFQQILLKDSSSRMVYATIINQNTIGFDGTRYDFQMIVPENEYSTTPTPYYLYVELI